MLHASDGGKVLLIYFYKCLPTQCLHNSNESEWMKNSDCFNKRCCTIPLNLKRIPMLFDIFILTLFMCCFHERFSSISTPRNFVTFSLSVTMLSIFKKGSDSLKNLFFLRLGEIWNILFLLNLAVIYLL